MRADAFVWGAVNVSGVNFAKPANVLQSMIALLAVVCCILTNAVIIGSVTTTLSRLNYARHTARPVTRRRLPAACTRYRLPRARAERARRLEAALPHRAARTQAQRLPLRTVESI